ncbi:hypothetical protein NQ317_007366 [Molorchus minor]|uniref:Calcium signal-modulating cyclophilin ligand n=1 Tax=Molorchus minor TaxID=1323400 RepID=A0ABQ9JAP2_9CUCU|nr:hypothetical protein NQ317_007366 [Molorchus minor]
MSDLESRREARRRKILENSERRLSKISGVEQKSTKSELDGIKLSTAYSDEENTLIKERALVHDGVPHTTNYMSSSSAPELKTIFLNSRLREDDSVSNYQVQFMEHRFRNVKIFLLPAILSVILVLFDCFKIDVKHMYLNKIFIPLLAYEIIEYFVAHSENNSSPSILRSVLLLTNRSRLFTAYLGYLEYLFKIMQDITVYFFVFAVSHGFLSLILL